MLSTFGSDCVALLDAQWSLTVVYDRSKGHTTMNGPRLALCTPYSGRKSRVM